jgi:hypothetical protein
MIVLGLSGRAGSGKTSVADYLAQQYGFIKFSFAAGVYREVAAAYGLPDADALRDRRHKELPVEALCLEGCADKEFVELARGLLEPQYPRGCDLDIVPLSPRWLLQHWGTDYRRAQDPTYWVGAAHRHIAALRAMYQYPEVRPQLFVCDDLRFENERASIRDGAWDGGIWHIRRDGLVAVNDHVSETPLPVLEGERELWNNDTIQRLHQGIDLLLSTSAKFVRVEPMVPDAPPDTSDLARAQTEDAAAAGNG